MCVNLLSSLLTHSMVQSPSWEANWFAASQEIPRTSRNLKVHYRTHKHPPPVSILGPPNPVHIPTSHLLEIRPNIIHPFTTRSPQWTLSLRFPHQAPIHPPLLTHTRETLMLRNMHMRDACFLPTYIYIYIKINTHTHTFIHTLHVSDLSAFTKDVMQFGDHTTCVCNPYAADSYPDLKILLCQV